MELNWKAWSENNGHSFEEYAVASLLWDFYDPKTRYDHDPGDYFSSYKDNVDLSLSEIWRVIGDTENNDLNNMKDVYDAFIARANDNVHPLRNEDGTPVTTSDVREIFIAHGFFDDFNSNHRFEPERGERVGCTAHPPLDRYGRRCHAPLVPGAYLLVHLQDSQGIPLGGRVRVVVRFDNPYYDYSYEARVPDDGLLYLQPAPSDVSATIEMTGLYGGGYSDPFVIDNASYWSLVTQSQTGYATEATLTVDKFLIYFPLVVRNAGTSAQPTPTPTSTPTPLPEGPIPDRFLFSIGAQAPVGQFNFSHGAWALDRTQEVAYYLWMLPVGIAVDAIGNVYVADVMNHRVQYISSDGVFLGTWGQPGDGEGQFDEPSGIAVGPDGTVYVVDGSNDRIQRFSATGEFRGKWGSEGSGDGQFKYPTGVAVASDSTVYVADTKNHRIQRFSSMGQFLGKWGSEGDGDGQFAGPSGVAVAPDGTVYVADMGNHRIQRFTATGQFLGKWGSWGNGDGQFYGPQDVAVAPDSTVYVLDSPNYIQRFSATGQFLEKWRITFTGLLPWPSGIAISSDGTVYVGEAERSGILRFTATGQAMGEWGSRGRSGGQFMSPADVAVAPGGKVYVADTGNQRIQRFTATGQLLGEWGAWGLEENGHFYGPAGVAVAPDGTVYVADSGNERIQHFSATGQFLGKWGSEGSGDGQFECPARVAVASDGTVYVTDSCNDRVQRFSATGQFLGKWGSEGSGDGQFKWPHGVAVASDGTVYVVDTGNHRIQRFSATGQFLGKWGSEGSGDGQFKQPRGVAVAPNGTVYVADRRNHRIQRFSATGEFWRKWGSSGNGDGQFRGPQGVAVASDGTVYVVEEYNLRIQAFGTAYLDTWRGEYFGNRWLAEAPVLIRNEPELNFNWGTGSPGPGVPADNFSARWQRYVWFEPGTYRFTVSVDDGVRLWVGDQLLIEAWQDQIATYSADISLTQGYHRVRLEYYESGGSAAVQLSWSVVR